MTEESNKKSSWKESNNNFIVVRGSKIEGRGVYAKQDIPEGTQIIEYTGEIISKEEGDRRVDEQDGNGGIYIFDLDDEHDIDGSVDGNEAHLINHSCDPNCESHDIDNGVWIVATKAIKMGEELSYDYGYEDDDALCKCGSPNCRGKWYTEPVEEDDDDDEEDSDENEDDEEEEEESDEDNEEENDDDDDESSEKDNESDEYEKTVEDNTDDIDYDDKDKDALA